METRYCQRCEQKRDFRWALKVPGNGPFGDSILYCVECQYEMREEE